MPPPRAVPPELSGRPFLLAEARQLGLSDDVLRGRRFRRLFRSVYVTADTPHSLELQVDAVRLLLPAATFTHDTAALLRRLPVPPSDRIHVTVPTASERPRLPGVRPHHRTPARVLVEGRPVSAPADNFVELAASLTLVELVVLGDAMARRQLITSSGLVTTVGTTARGRGIRIARRAASLVRAGVDSPMETQARLLVVLAGLPEPIPNLTVRDADGGWLGEVDLGYRACRVAVEYHGDVHRSAPRRWRADIAKGELLRRLGWQVVVLTADDLYVRPALTLSRVHDALVDAGHPEVPAVLDSAWREHFGRRELARTGQLVAAS